jgi:hypothetical protein
MPGKPIGRPKVSVCGDNLGETKPGALLVIVSAILKHVFSFLLDRFDEDETECCHTARNGMGSGVGARPFAVFE